MSKLYKSLPKDMSPRGHTYEIGKWYKHKGKISICNEGFHASENIIDAMGFVNAEFIAEVEVRGESEIQEDKQCWSEIKIVKAYEWTKPDSLKLAIFSAEKVLANFEKVFPEDMRPREAIEAAKKVLLNDTEENRSAAESAAWSAWSAARSAWLAARSARSAAWSAARSARSAAWSAARSARSARSAAWSAESAESAAWSARKKLKKELHNFVLSLIKDKKPLTK